MIEDGCEVLEFIQDVYDVLVDYKDFHRMMTDSLLKIFYVPVVIQSLCVMTIKPKIQTHTALFLLTQTITLIKDSILQRTLI